MDKFNILKELVIQNLLFNMPSAERHNFIMNHRLMDIHKIFNRFYLNNIPIITNNSNKESLIFSLIVKSEPDIMEKLIESQ